MTAHDINNQGVDDDDDHHHYDDDDDDDDDNDDNGGTGEGAGGRGSAGQEAEVSTHWQAD